MSLYLRFTVANYQAAQFPRGGWMLTAELRDADVQSLVVALGMKNHLTQMDAEEWRTLSNILEGIEYTTEDEWQRRKAVEAKVKVLASGVPTQPPTDIPAVTGMSEAIPDSERSERGRAVALSHLLCPVCGTRGERGETGKLWCIQCQRAF